MQVLGIESSCDDTAAAVVEDGSRLLAAERLSSALLQRRYGGVVPEVAAREHAVAILPAVVVALESAGIKAGDLDAVAVTRGPGLLGALLVGVTFAKALAAALELPVVGIHHLEGHLYANALVAPIRFPALALIVSGGHTTLILWENHGAFQVLGQTRDDAAGEALDKGARILGLNYPGGPEIEQLAREASDKPAFTLPVARVDGAPLDFSFSGLKTAFDELARRHPDERPALALALEKAVVDALMRGLDLAFKAHAVNHVYLAGGVTANQRLAKAVRTWGEAHQVEIHIPPVEYCTDNAAMVAAAGYFRLAAGEVLGLADGPRTPWPLAYLGRGGSVSC
jgi:N6-L-threonylcarbamoyladenine synthase